MCCTIWRYEAPAFDCASSTAGSPLLLACRIFSSSGTIAKNRDVEDGLDVLNAQHLAPFHHIRLHRLRMSRGLYFSSASSRPTMRSASRTAETSGLVTIIASSAPATAFLKPFSIPAGQSIRT